MTALYQIRDIKQIYEDRVVLDVPYLDVREGEILSLVGPSGAGKSTLLRLLNFLEPPTTGIIHYRDTVFDAEHSVPLDMRRKVTTVFQRPILLKRSVRGNIAFGLRIRGNRDGENHVRAALERVGLLSLANQSAGTLSGGEAQRVALARAMVLRPDVLLLDEPTANLDPYNVRLIEDIIRELNDEFSMTVVLVTHNVFQARRLADRAALLLGGQLVEIADKEAFFNAPSDPRTVAFVQGEMVY